MKLHTILGHVDDPRLDPMLARVGCGICELRGKPVTVQAVPDDDEVVSEEHMLEVMAAWSHTHAAAHSRLEHVAHEAFRLYPNRFSDFEEAFAHFKEREPAG